MKQLIGDLICLVLATAYTAGTAYAASCGGVDTAIISCDDGGYASGGIWAVVQIVLNILGTLVALAAVVGITYAGVVYLTARDNEQQVMKAKARIREAVIGLAAFVLLFSVANFLLPNYTVGPQGGDPMRPVASDTGGVSGDTSGGANGGNGSDGVSGGTQGGGNDSDAAPSPGAASGDGDNSDGSIGNMPTNAVSVTVLPQQPSGYYEPYEVTWATAGAIPYTYAPNGGKATNRLTIPTTLKNSNVVAFINAGTFNMASGANNAAVGTTIVEGQVVTNNGGGTTFLVIDAQGRNPGWAPYGTSAESLANGTATYYDIYGRETTGQAYSVVSDFGPIVIGGKVANGQDGTQDFSRTTGHYVQKRARQVLCVKDDAGTMRYAFITNKNEQGAGGWNFDDMAGVALAHGCTFAYNLDGGGSVLLRYRDSTSADFTQYAVGRDVPTYLVLTADNQPPQTW